MTPTPTRRDPLPDERRCRYCGVEFLPDVHSWRTRKGVLRLLVRTQASCIRCQYPASRIQRIPSPSPTTADGDAESGIMNRELVSKMLAPLDRRARFIVERWMESATLAETAYALGVTHQRVQSILAITIRKIQRRWPVDETSEEVGSSSSLSSPEVT